MFTETLKNQKTRGKKDKKHYDAVALKKTKTFEDEALIKENQRLKQDNLRRN